MTNCGAIWRKKSTSFLRNLLTSRHFTFIVTMSHWPLVTMTFLVSLDSFVVSSIFFVTTLLAVALPCFQLLLTREFAEEVTNSALKSFSTTMRMAVLSLILSNVLSWIVTTIESPRHSYSRLARTPNGLPYTRTKTILLER